MATPNYNLPTISGNMTADVVRDMNALADATDSAIKTVDTKVDNHIKDDLGHVRYIGNASAVNTWVCTSDNIIWETSGAVRAKEGSSYRIRVYGSNTGNVTLTLKNTDGSKVSSAYPVLNLDGTQLVSGTVSVGAIVTVSFNGSSFFLQGSGSGVNVTRGSQTFSTPGTHAFTVPKGVSKLTAYIWGAGGGGGSASDTGSRHSGAGGGGGAFLLAAISVTSNQVISIKVGDGGEGGRYIANGYGENGSTGGRSGITLNGVDYIAGGGQGGEGGTLSGAGLPGKGGSYNIDGSGYTSDGMDGTKFTFPSSASRDLLICYSGGGGGYPGGQTYNPIGGGGGAGACDSYGGRGGYGRYKGYNIQDTIREKGGDGGYGSSYSDSSYASVGSDRGGGGGGGCGGGDGMYNYRRGAKGGNGQVILYW